MYHVTWNNRPLCDHMGCEAGRLTCKEAGVDSCSYRTHREAVRACRKLNALPGYAGVSQVVSRDCPRSLEIDASA